MKPAATAFAAALALLAGSPAGVSAQEPTFGTVQFFDAHCRASLDDNNTTDLFRQGQCSGMLLALHFVSEQLATNLKFCSPAGTKAGELVQVAMAYTAAHPDRASTPLMDTAIQAFKERWPCGK